MGARCSLREGRSISERADTLLSSELADTIDLNRSRSQRDPQRQSCRTACVVERCLGTIHSTRPAKGWEVASDGSLKIYGCLKEKGQNLQWLGPVVLFFSFCGFFPFFVFPLFVFFHLISDRHLLFHPAGEQLARIQLRVF